ncbi:MAG: Spy/CpxP family protein refolding chaperone [Bacteroidota bacterium]
MRLILLCALVLGLASGATAQHDHNHDHGEGPMPTESGVDASDPVPTGLTASGVSGLLAGAGMGLAKPAELHSYPGPLQVLEHADALALTDAQLATTQALRAEVVEQASELGARIVGMERHLDQLFASGEATPEAVDRITGHIAQAQGQLRAVHLRAHVAMQAALTPEQIVTYDRLRGHSD